MPIVKAAAVQLSPVLYSREGTIGKVVKKILELGRQGVQFATFPETVVPYYPYFSFVEAPYLMGAEHQIARSGGDPAVRRYPRDRRSR
jgi:nitrilase